MLIQQLTTRVLIIPFGFNNITERRERSIELRTNLQNKNRKNTDHKKTRKKGKKKKKKKSNIKNIVKKGKDFGREN